MSQSVRRRIRAFDERMAILANGGAKVAANENSDSESDQGEGEDIQRSPVVPEFFFPVGPVRKLKMPSQEENHPTMNVARLGLRKTNVGARKAGLVT